MPTSIPIRLTDNTQFKTDATPSLYGVVPISFSLFIKVERNDGFVDDGMGRLLGFNWTHSHFMAHNTIVASVRMHSGSSNIADVMNSGPLALGTVYHVAYTIANGMQKLYVNGDMVNGKTYSGTEGALNDTASYPFELSCTDLMTIQVQEPVIWSGYELAQADVLNIRDGASPSTISPSNIKWHLVFSGANGTTVTTADPSLQDQSGNGYNVTSIAQYNTSTPPVVAPTYVGTPLSYIIPAQVSSAVVTPTRTGIVLHFRDLNNNIVAVTSIITNPQLTTQSMNGGLAFQLTNPVWAVTGHDRDWIYYPFMAGAIGQNDTPTLTVPTSGWAKTSAGDVAPLSARTVDNTNKITLLPPFVSNEKAMGAGYNLGYMPLYYSTVPMYANMARQISSFYNATATFDQYGYPTTIQAGQTLQSIVNISPSDGVGDGKNMCNAPSSGTWTLMWDGTGTDPNSGNSVLYLNGGQTGETITETSRDIAPLGETRADNTIRYSITQDQSYFWSPNVYLSVRYAPFTNLRIYPPGVATDGSQKFHPEYVKNVTGSKCLRFMTTIDAPGPQSGGAVVDYSDYTPAQMISYGIPTRSFSATVIRVEPYPDTENYFGNQSSALVTFSAPHGLKDGAFVTFEIPGPNADNSFPLANGQTGFLTVNAMSGAATLMVRLQANPNQVATPLVPGQSGKTTLTATYNGSWSAHYNYSAGLPPSEAVDLCNLVGAHLWISLSYSATDSCVTNLSNMVAQRLHQGLKFYFEYSNECWNGVYPGFDYVEQNSRITGLSHAGWFARRTAQVHDLAHAALVNFGRGGDLVRVFGSQSANPDVTNQIVNYASANGLLVDAVAVAPYFNNELRNETSIAPLIDSLTPDQLMDLGDLSIVEGGFSIPDHYYYLTPSYPNAKIVCYEGGPEWGTSASNLGNGALVRRSHVWGRHPRMRWIMLYYLQVLQNGGCDLFNDFYVSSTDESARGYNWGAYNTWNMKPGLGDGSDGLYDNRLDFENSAQIVSVVGGAINYWNSLLPGGIIPPPSLYKKIDLSTLYNRIGIYDNGSTFPNNGGIDASGFAASATLLGTSITWSGVPFDIGTIGFNNVVYSADQTVNFPSGNYTSIRFLGLGVQGSQPGQIFKARYSDNTVDQFVVSLSDWSTPRGYLGEAIATVMPYRLMANGSRDNLTFYVYGYAINVNSAKSLVGFILPSNSNVILFSMTLVNSQIVVPSNPFSTNIMRTMFIRNVRR